MNDKIITLPNLPQADIINYGVEVSDGHSKDANGKQLPCKRSLGFLQRKGHP